MANFIINPILLADISWTGRGKGDEKKIPLKRYVHIVDLLNVLARKADGKMTRRKVQKQLTYTVLKRTPGIINKKSSPSASSSTSSGAVTPTPSESALLGMPADNQTRVAKLQNEQQQQQQDEVKDQQTPQQVLHVETIHSNTMKPMHPMKHMQPMQPMQPMKPMPHMPYYGYPWHDNGYQYI